MLTLYRWLLRLYPAGFRDEYGAALETQFRDEQRAGTLGAVAMLSDVAATAPRERLREIARDLRYSVRMYTQRPLVTTLAVVTLALAIGAATGVFSVVNAVLLRSLPFRAPQRIVQLEMFPGGGLEGTRAFHDWRAASPYLEDAALYDTAELNLMGASGSRRVNVAETTWNFFSMLGSEPIRGRAFAAGEDVKDRDEVAVISYALWQQAFGGDPRTIGSTIEVSGAKLTVVGIARPGFDYPAKSAIWTPTTFDLRKLSKSGVIMWQRIGRLKPGVTFAQASQMMAAEAERLRPGATNRSEESRPHLVPLQQRLSGPVRQASLVLLGGVIFVLLIACANVANLLLTRLADRRRELGVRAALGAGHGRLMRQLVTENLALTGVATLLGLLVAWWAASLGMSVQPQTLSIQKYSILDWRVLGFAAGLAMLTGIAFGVLPASLMRRLTATGDFASAHGRSQAQGAGRIRRVLIATQAALTLVLLSGSIVIGRGFLRLVDAPLGFQTEHLATLSVSLAGSQIKSNAQRLNYYREALNRLRAIPSVEAAGGTDYVPLTGAPVGGAMFKSEAGKESLMVFANVTPGYFRAMGLPVTMGRDFTGADSNSSSSIAIITERAARSLGGSKEVLGHSITFNDGTKLVSQTVVGIVADSRLSPGADEEVMPPRIYQPYAPTFMTFVARVRGPAEDALAVCRDALQSVDERVPVFDVRTMEDRLAEAVARPRFYTTVVLFFGAFALLIAMVGIYGAATYAIAQRKHEIGVRLAIGATPPAIRRMLLRGGLVPLVAGSLAGLAGAAALGKSIEHLLESAQRVDLVAPAGAAVLLIAVALGASWIATRRVVRLDPIQVLRAE